MLTDIEDGKYSRNLFDVCDTGLYSSDDVGTEKHISLRQAVQTESACGEQGFTRLTSRCKCFNHTRSAVYDVLPLFHVKIRTVVEHYDEFIMSINIMLHICLHVNICFS